MLTLTFLGVGAAFAKRNFNSNALLEAWGNGPDGQDAPDDTLLIDFGVTGPLALHQLKSKPGFEYLDRNGLIYYPAIRRLLVTHLHADHIGGIEELAGMNMHIYGKPYPAWDFRCELVGSPCLLGDLWDRSLRGGLGALDGRWGTLDDYFTVQALRPTDQGGPEHVSLLDRYDCSIFPTDHLRIHNKYDWPSSGVRVRDRQTGETVFYSGDTRFDPDVYGVMLNEASTVFHEVQLFETPSPVHTFLSELRTLPDDLRQKMWLYHYGDTWDDQAYAGVSDEFRGFAQPFHRYKLFS